MGVFLEKCKVFNQVSNTICEEVDKLAEKLIQLDFEDTLGQNIKKGLNTINVEVPLKKLI